MYPNDYSLLEIKGHKHLKRKSLPRKESVDKVAPTTESNDDDNLRNDIERVLFTKGLVNAPGVNHRMQRLKSRTRILPNLSEGMIQTIF